MKWFRKETRAIVTLVLFAVAPVTASADNICDLTSMAPEQVEAAARVGREKTQKIYDTLKDPGKTLGVNVANLDRDLSAQLSPKELSDLTAKFHGALVEAAQGKDGRPNPFAADNVNHVALHYRDLEKHRANIDRQFRKPGTSESPTDLALLNASAHDIGKIAELIGMVSPEVLDVYNKAVADAPQMAFFLKTILGHDGLTMNGISNLVKKFGAEQGWNEPKMEKVTQLLQAASARHNAGYDKLANDKDRGVFHFWQTSYPQFAAKMRAQGLDVSDEYPAATGGWMPALLAMVDRGTSLHPSFVEKIAGQGNFVWSADSVGGLLKGNARSVREEIQSIGKELAKHSANPDINKFSLYRQYMKMADESEALGQKILDQNDFTKPYASRPAVTEEERTGYVYYQQPSGDWFRVEKSGLLQKHAADGWHIQTVDGSMSAAQILMKKLIGYTPIDNAAPRLSTQR